MSPDQWEILAIACVTAAACALPGAFLMLRGMAMMSDAVSHAILPGIVIAYLIVQDLASPVLVLGAAATGVLTVALIEALRRTGLVREDSAVALVFPALFSIGVILIAREAGRVHLDTDSVLLGELAFAPFERFAPGGLDLGPRALALMSGIFLLDFGLMLLFYKELQVTIFDPGFAAALGFRPAAIQYGLTAMVSVTAVGAFDAAGSVLVVALMVAPPAAASLWVNRLPALLALSVGFAVLSASSGTLLARALDASIAGSMAVAAGAVFAVSHLLSPDRGIVAARLRQRGLRRDLALETLCVHLLQHQGLPEAATECRLDHLGEHLRFPPPQAREIVALGARRGLLAVRGDHLELTPEGIAHARERSGT